MVHFRNCSQLLDPSSPENQWSLKIVNKYQSYHSVALFKLLILTAQKTPSCTLSLQKGALYCDEKKSVTEEWFCLSAPAYSSNLEDLSMYNVCSKIVEFRGWERKSSESLKMPICFLSFFFLLHQFLGVILDN